MDEYERLKYTKAEFENLIKETKMRLNVVKRTDNIDIESMVKKINSLENKIKKLEFGINKPYFARIDFKNIEENEKNICYIGKTGVMNSDDDVIVVDWRAPISSLYYDSNIGKCSYVSPEGLIEGELFLKRQYHIENGNLISYDDVNLVSNDEILNSYLSINSDERLKNIISTIQTEQNKIIRKKINENIIVQGVAGSGKTTIALHRIAYLVYAYKNHIENNQYMIIGPNKFFMKSISNILPDLDVDLVKQFDFNEFALDYIDENIKIDNELDKKSTKIKTSLYYKNIVEKYIEDLENIVIPKDDLKMYGFKILDRNYIKDIYINSGNYTDILSKVDRCILLVENNINSIKDKLIIEAHKYINDLYEEELEESKKEKIINHGICLIKEIKNNCHNLLKKYFKVINESVLTLYTKFLNNIEKYEKCEEKLITFRSYDKKIRYEDLPALIYLKYRVYGNTKYNKYRHIVVDEAQDYNEFVFFVMKQVLKNATFSIFGDLAQSIYQYRSIENWNVIKNKVMDLEIMVLSKSYRTTIEIMNEANKINRHLKLNEAEPVIRHGNSVKYIKIKDNYELINEINYLKHKNYDSIAIISKDEQISNDIYNKLKNDIEITNINYNFTEYKGGVCTITSSLCKGLEFDAVIINAADEEIFNSNSKNDMKLLYVSMTRALHELIITYQTKCPRVLEVNCN